MTIEELQIKSHRMAKEKGWHDEPRTVGDLIALCHSELSEALEIHRTGTPLTAIFKNEDKPEGFPVELADLIIRICDMAEYLGIDLELAIEEKIKFNSTREYRHGGKTI